MPSRPPWIQCISVPTCHCVPAGGFIPSSSILKCGLKMVNGYKVLHPHVSCLNHLLYDQKGYLKALLNIRKVGGWSNQSNIYPPFVMFGRFSKKCPLDWLDLFCLRTALFPPKVPAAQSIVSGPIVSGSGFATPNYKSRCAMETVCRRTCTTLPKE